MEINLIIVRIASERIVNKGLNPKTNKTYIIDDVKNLEYRKAIEDYILKNTEEV